MNEPRASVSARAVRLAVVAALALFLSACMHPDDRIAGSSTEAGNAEGKLSLSDGRPAADVSVALVARAYLPDTSAAGSAPADRDQPGSYYRTRTGPDGKYVFKDIAPGEYRVIAVGRAGGAMADSVSVRSGEDTTLAEQVLKPLGGIRGIAKIVGSDAKVNIYVRPKATLATPPRANPDGGAFRLDSLPEGEYELVPQCYSCQPLPKGYTVRVKAGRDTVLADTLKLYPEYFFGFPDSGTLSIRSSWLPFQVGGKLSRGDEDRARPSRVAWTWNGATLASREERMPEGISATFAVLDSNVFHGEAEGRLRLVLAFPDTTVVREWRVALDVSNPVWPLSAVETDRAVRLAGYFSRTIWRFHVKHALALDPADVAFWGVRPEAAATSDSLPAWVDLAVDAMDQGALGGDSTHMTFILLPDAKFGGRVFRPRTDESLGDFREIRYLDKARFGFRDSLLPSMLPGGLIADRLRASDVRQRYRIDSLGRVRELLGPIPVPGHPLPDLSGPDSMDELVLFYRLGPAAAGFAWDKPTRDAAKILAVTREGFAVRLDAAGTAVNLPAEELAALVALLAPLSQDPPDLPDTATLAETGTLEYLHAGRRGLARTTGAHGPADTLFPALQAWMVRNGLDQVPRFPLTAGTSAYLAFEADSAGFRYTGDTLLVTLENGPGGAMVREYLSARSPARSLDSSAIVYGLAVDGDSLVGISDSTRTSSRLFGPMDGRIGLLALAGLKTVTPVFRYDIPILSGNGNTLSGRLEGKLSIHGREVAGPSLFLDARNTNIGEQGFLYTGEGGLERAWRSGKRSDIVRGWDRL